MRPHIRLLSLILGVLLLGSCATERQALDLVRIDGLGSLSFPNSGADEAQDAFLRGVLLLHSFEYGAAAAAFRQAQEIDPDFALAYWGEAMTKNHPLWRRTDPAAAHEVLLRFAPTREERLQRVTDPRERKYLESVEILFGEGTKEERDLAYMDAMEALHHSFPEDDEARAFYALSILGSTNGERDFEVYGRAARTAEPVFRRNPDHPGAAHYIIHSYDDPAHAEHGRAAAEAYSGIAPEAAHAQHMTTHIFVALGMWDRVVENNIRAMEVQNAGIMAAGGAPLHCGHYSSWRHYGHLQLGEFGVADSLMTLCHASVGASSTDSEWWYFASMRALQVLDSEDWSLVDRWTASPPTEDLSHAAPGDVQTASIYHFTNAFAAIMRRDADEARSEYGKIPAALGGDRVVRMQIEGMLALSDDQVEEGLEILTEAAETEVSYPFMYGPPNVPKPSYELLGEALLEAGRVQDARQAFARALERTPGRRLAVRGAEAARAANI